MSISKRPVTENLEDRAKYFMEFKKIDPIFNKNIYLISIYNNSTTIEDGYSKYNKYNIQTNTKNIDNPIITEECGIDNPFLKNGNCIYSCTQSEFESKECEISNSIIKTQWITNIIPFGDKNFRYVKIANFSNNDMIAITTSESSNKRMFYGLKENGHYYFNQNSNETPYYTFEIDDATRNEAEFFVIKLNGNNGKEYLISIANGDGYAELYDFEDFFDKKKTSSIFSNLKSNAVNSFALSYTSSNKYYTLFGCLHPENNYQSVYIYKLNFNTVNSIKNDNIVTKTLISEYSIEYE